MFQERIIMINIDSTLEVKKSENRMGMRTRNRCQDQCIVRSCRVK